MRPEDITVPLELSLPPPITKAYKTELEQVHQASRLAWTNFTLLLLLVNLGPPLLIPDWTDSAMKRIALVTELPDVFFGAYLLSIVLMAPFVFMTIFLPRCRWRRTVNFGAAVGGLIAFAAWGLLGGMSLGLDFGNYSFLLFLTAAANLSFAFTLALSRNHEVLREVQRGCD